MLNSKQVVALNVETLTTDWPIPMVIHAVITMLLHPGAVTTILQLLIQARCVVLVMAETDQISLLKSTIRTFQTGWAEWIQMKSFCGTSWHNIKLLREIWNHWYQSQMKFHGVSSSTLSWKETILSSRSRSKTSSTQLSTCVKTKRWGSTRGGPTISWLTSEIWEVFSSCCGCALTTWLAS